MPLVRKTFKFKCPDQTLRSHNFMVYSMKGEFIAGRVFMNITEGPPILWLKFFQFHAISSWTEPFRIKFRINMGPEYKFSWGIKFPDYKQFLFAGFCDDFCFIFTRHDRRF